MEKVRCSLSKLLRTLNKGFELKNKQLLSLIFNLISAVKTAHAHGVMHRDLKPKNILVYGDCDVVLCDFGLSRSTLTDPGPQRVVRQLSYRVCTSEYRPPEIVLKASHYDEKTDIWSLGCTLFEIFKGQANAKAG